MRYATLQHILARSISASRADLVANTLLERYLYLEGSDAGHASWRRRRYQILVYHKVSTEQHPFFKGVTPQAFEDQMKLLRELYRVFPLPELVERAASGDVPKRAVALTFDDGYEDNYLHAFPVLRRYGLPATIFLATGCIGNRSVLWHDRVFDAFRYAEVKQARWQSYPEIQVDLTSMQMARSSLRETLRHARSMEPDGRDRFLEEIETTLRPDLQRVERTRMLNWEQVGEMANSGISFGSHTVTHPILSRTTTGQLEAELVESKAEIESRLHTPVREFAYPNGQAGDYNGQVKTALRKAGYTCAVTSRPGLNFARGDLFELRRGQPWVHDPDVWRLLFFLQRHGLYP